MLLDLDFREKDIQNFRISLKLSQLSSVDAFLENRPEFIPIGKMAIAYTLLQDEDPDFIAKDCNWYNFLWGKLHCPFDNFQENKLSIITFNYDRSIEFFLMNAMKHTYGKSIKECYEKLSSIPIIHLHGKLGSLPWEGDDYTKFGAEIQTKNELKKVGEKIKIIHEDISTNEEFTSAFNMIANAERIYFLGLSYSETNIQRLKIPILDVNGKDIRGSVLNLSSTQIEDIKQFTNRKIALAHSSYDCLMFLKEFAPLN